MAKKKSAAVPAMYPKPEPIELAPRKVVSAKHDGETLVLTLEGAIPKELQDAEKQMAWRLNLAERLCGYAETCLQRLEPYWGKRPDTVPRSEWIAKHLHEHRLPSDAPMECQDAYSAVEIMRTILKLLEDNGPITPQVRAALCLAIDLGQLLQRGQSQMDFGNVVDRGKRSIKSTDVAKSAKQQESQKKSATAEAEFNRRMVGRTSRHATATLKNMATIRGVDGKLKYGSYRQLVRYRRDWISATPTD